MCVPGQERAKKGMVVSMLFAPQCCTMCCCAERGLNSQICSVNMFSKKKSFHEQLDLHWVQIAILIGVNRVPEIT